MHIILAMLNHYKTQISSIVARETQMLSLNREDKNRKRK